MSDHMKIDWTVVDLRARIATLEAQLADRVKVDDVLDAASEYIKTQYGIGALSHPTDRNRILSALEATPPAPPGWSRVTEDDGAKYLNPPDGWLNTELTTPPAPKVTDLKLGLEGLGKSLQAGAKDHVVGLKKMTLTAAQEAGKP